MSAGMVDPPTVHRHQATCGLEIWNALDERLHVGEAGPLAIQSSDQPCARRCAVPHCCKRVFAAVTTLVCS